MDAHQPLDTRRRALGMSFEALSRRSGVSVPTCKRILHGRAKRPSLSNVAAIAEALGMSVRFEALADAAEFRRRRAAEKARELVGMVQATSALESQAVDAAAMQELLERTTEDLAGGSPRRLWG